jgi:hypothetical protein
MRVVIRCAGTVVESRPIILIAFCEIRRERRPQFERRMTEGDPARPVSSRLDAEILNAGDVRASDSGRNRVFNFASHSI